MVFVSATELSRKWSKAFEWINYSTVLFNNEDIGMIIGSDLARKLRESGILEEYLEEMEIENNRSSLEKHWSSPESNNLSDFVI